MFGLFRKTKPAKPLRLVPFAEDRPAVFTALLCDGLSAYGLPSFAALRELHARLQQERPNVRVLASLDDLHQAMYTSGHAIDTRDLDAVEGHDLSSLPPEAFADGEHRGHLSLPAEFPIRLANLLARARDVTLDQAAGYLNWETTGDANDLVTINADPETPLRIGKEKAVLFQFVPVTAAAETLAALPNGYFVGDLSPMQNLALARRLEDQHGLALFGIGSRFLGFRRQTPLDAAAARALADELAGFYADTPSGKAAELAALLTGRDWLLLRYTES